MSRKNQTHGKPGPKQGQAYGIASVSNALSGVDFPMSKNDLISSYGDKQIEWTKGHHESLKSVLTCSDSGAFDSMADVVSAVSRCYKKAKM